MFWFVVASLMPAALLAAAFAAGGVWPALALGYTTVVVALTDKFGTGHLPVRDEAAVLRAADRLSVVLALAHFGLLAWGLWAICAAEWLGLGQSVLAALALGLFMGQVSHPNAHELIHRPSRGLRMLGAGIYVSLLFGHHVSAHLRVHHVAVATPEDPNSAPKGQSFYRFWPRAWIGSFRAGLAAESAAMRRRQRPAPVWRHPYVMWCAGAVLCLCAAYGVAGGRGVAVYVALAGYAQAQLLMADYVQHYGLRRQRRADGRREPAGAQHSWNARPWYSSAMMLNAPRHSDHHLNPMRAYPALRLDPDMPVLPYAMPVMAVLALAPPVWRRVMDPRVARWSAAAGGVGQTGVDLPQSGHADAVPDSP
ncbi:alkane 1-monooxygenase [Seohaeicola saemankumensis]|nr:alkane 1-monooxygenase [Seohaeicola saemankumensis]MCA0872047.1 alkane 1-monooxygenase [Seohaeicola saemankumensis]